MDACTTRRLSGAERSPQGAGGGGVEHGEPGALFQNGSFFVCYARALHKQGDPVNAMAVHLDPVDTSTGPDARARSIRAAQRVLNSVAAGHRGQRRRPATRAAAWAVSVRSVRPRRTARVEGCRIRLHQDPGAGALLGTISTAVFDEYRQTYGCWRIAHVLNTERGPPVSVGTVADTSCASSS